MANDCSSYSPSYINGDGAASQLASYGACAGTNALLDGIVDSTVVQDVEAAIQEGLAEAAQITGFLTIGLSVLSDVGIATAASASVIPVVGIIAGIALGIADALQSLFGDGLQIYVPNPYASPGSNTVAWNGSVWEKISTQTYVTEFIPNAMNWLKDPANMRIVVGDDTTSGMTPEQFSALHNVFLDSTVPAQLIGSPLSAVANPIGGPDQYALLASNPPPGAYEMLRAVQLPVAAAVVATMPTFANLLTANDHGGVGAPLLARFPALQPSDMQAIFGADLISGPNGAYTNAYEGARQFVNNSCPPPSIQTIQTSYALPYSDACRLLMQWHYAGQGQCSSPMPTCPPQVPVNVIKSTGGYGPPIGSSGGVFGSGSPTELSRPTSATKVLVAGATIVGIGAVLYHVFVGGYTFYSTGKAVIGETKKLYGGAKSWIERRFHRGSRKRNPIQLERKSATGGRAVAYRVDLDGRDRIALTKSGALLFRNERLVAKFKASKFQKTKIRSGEGEVLVFTDQLE